MALDKGRLEEIATAIALMYDPEVYSKLKTEINKPNGVSLPMNRPRKTV